MTAIIREFNGVSPKIHETAFIAENAAVIGNVEIGPKSSVWYGCVIRGDMNYIRIGANTNIQDGTVIHVDSEGEHWNGMPTLIGDNVTVGHRAMLHACTLEDNSFGGRGIRGHGGGRRPGDAGQAGAHRPALGRCAGALHARPPPG
jgi:carbonic anhydrase/acetyltransferase-like protein (isoleucine patch superfamily)